MSCKYLKFLFFENAVPDILIFLIENSEHNPDLNRKCYFSYKN